MSDHISPEKTKYFQGLILAANKYPAFRDLCRKSVGVKDTWLIKFMRVSVFDTYVTRNDGRVMHFDILVPESEQGLEKIYSFGQDFIASKNEKGRLLSARECKFCHIEDAAPEIVASIDKQGFHIIEMENCD